MQEICTFTLDFNLYRKVAEEEEEIERKEKENMEK